jgi:hypothetical protein
VREEAGEAQAPLNRVAPRAHLVLAASLALLAAGAQTAVAATITTDHACYRTGQRMRVTASGFPAGSQTFWRVSGSSLSARGGGILEVEGSPDGQSIGDGTFPLRAPALEDELVARATFELRAQGTVPSDTGENTVTTATTTAQVVPGFSARMTTLYGGPRHPVTYVVDGATELTPLWLHVTRFAYSRRSHRLGRRDIQLGTPAAPCGRLTRHVTPFAQARPASGIYVVDIDETQKPTVNSNDGTFDPEALPIGHVGTFVVPKGRHWLPGLPPGQLR